MIVGRSRYDAGAELFGVAKDSDEWSLSGLKDLLSVLPFYADAFMQVVDYLRDLESAANTTWKVSRPGADDIIEMGKSLSGLLEDCQKLELRTAAKQIDRILAAILVRVVPYDEFSRMLQELRSRIQDELEGRALFLVPSSKTALAIEHKKTFGEEVLSRFPSAGLDIEEACKCLATGRNTACVFHLMRVMEVALRALGKSLNDPRFDPKHNPTWDSILKKCDEELRKPAAQRDPAWASDSQFFSEVTANLRAVKDAWRNPSVHVEAHYDDERAQDVWNAVRAFMRHVATKLSE